MKKSLLSALLLLSFAGVAAAQSVAGVWSYKSPAARVGEAERIAKAFAEMEIYMGLVFGR